MKVITMLLNELKLMTRNPANLVLLLAMPVLMIALMGYAMKPFFNMETKGFEKFPVLYINQDQGPVGQNFSVFLQGQSQYLQIVTSDTETAPDVTVALEKAALPVALVAPAGLSEKVMNGEKAGIEIVSTGKDPIKDSILGSLVTVFVNQTNLQLGIIRGVQSLSTTQEVPDLAQIQADAVRGVNERYGNDFIQTRTMKEPPPAPSSANTPGRPTQKLTSFQFFAVSMLVFFLLMTGMGLGMNILIDRHERIFLRIGSYPVTRNQYLLGKTLGNGVIGIVQALVIILFTSFLFQINWGNHPFGLGLVILTVLLISSGIGVIASSVLNSGKALFTGLMVFFWMLTFISGGFTSIPIFEPLAKFTVNQWAFESMTAFMMGRGLGSVTGYLGSLIGLSLVLWALGVLLYQRRSLHE